jgi:putative flippase GtrA
MLSESNSRFRYLLKHAIGFANVGLLMTVASALLLYLLIQVLSWQVYIAYTLVYLASIFISYLLNAKLVFKKTFSWLHLGAFYVTYLSGMLLGLLLIFLFKSFFFSYTDFINSCLVTPITVAWNFIFTSMIFQKLKSTLIRPEHSSSE